VRYEAPPFGVGELWLDGERVVWSELPRGSAAADGPAGEGGSDPLAARLAAFFRGEPDDFADVELDLEDGFYGACARALRAVPRGEVVTYGELAALAGHPGAARAAGTFCARNRLSPFVPCHRVVAAGGIGSFGSLGVAYKRRLLALEGVAL
jgi:methylated-DNA-[protein]-cysteine S-methyltransferase